ncbi:MAG: polysaccharide biosynthesis protein [Veillonella sp.]
MTIPEASQLVLQAGAMGKGGEVFLWTWANRLKLSIWLEYDSPFWLS